MLGRHSGTPVWRPPGAVGGRAGAQRGGGSEARVGEEIQAANGRACFHYRPDAMSRGEDLRAAAGEVAATLGEPRAF